MIVKILSYLLLVNTSVAHTWKGNRSEREPVVLDSTRKRIREGTKKRIRGGTKKRIRAGEEDTNEKSKEDAEIVTFSPGNDEEENSENDRWFVQYRNKENKKEIEEFAEVIKDYSGDENNKNTMVIDLNNSKVQELLDREVITSAHQDLQVESTGSFQRILTDTRNLADLTTWGIKMIQADQLDVGPNPVKCCIIDTGYAIDHPDLPSDVTGDNAINKFEEVWDWKIDFNGHGTHIAGIIAALGNNDIGVVGAGDIPLHITRGLDDQSRGFESDVIDAVKQCVAAGAKVINVSLGSAAMSQTSNDLYTKVVNEDGVIVVAAAGNKGSKVHEYPASHPDVISVSAVYEWGKYWEGSNYSDQVELAAPGHSILSTTTTLTAVHTSDFSYAAVQVTGSRSREQRGALVDCGPGNRVCSAAQNTGRGGICLMSRDQTHLRRMVYNCAAGGGKGAIIFDASPNSDSSSSYARVNIPVVIVPTDVGIKLQGLLKDGNDKVSIGFHTSDQPEHSYAVYEGTSMAVPHVVAAAALLWSHFPECNNHEIRYALDISASDQGEEGCDMDYGYGIVKVKDAYEWLSNKIITEPCGSGSWGKPRRGGGCNTVE